MEQFMIIMTIKVLIAIFTSIHLIFITQSVKIYQGDRHG